MPQKKKYESSFRRIYYEKEDNHQFWSAIACYLQFIGFICGYINYPKAHYSRKPRY